MSQKAKEAGKAKRRGGRSRRKLRALHVVVIAALGAALVVALVWNNRAAGGASAEQIAAATGTLTAVATFHDFGRVSMKDGTVTYPFRLKNTGSEPALIRKIYTS